MKFLMVLSLLAMAPSWIDAIGCTNCLGQNVDKIRLGCFTGCSDAFTVGTNELLACRQSCTDFVFNRKCCSSTCSNSAKTCLANIGLAKRDFSGDEDTYEVEDLESPDLHSRHPRSFAVTDSTYSDIDRRLDKGKACCTAAKAAFTASVPLIAPAYNGDFGDDQLAGLILIAVGTAGTWACSKSFGINCHFFKYGPPAPAAKRSLLVTD
ncbi:uncharacterized protein BP5553_01716 [Venustampulla echinocandica]|uniref:Extracellular membrane protein CFEM domain-containing protein n=1 Tax=Venustampulla echinocandica TaxID=2656787 RepID=A0A370U1T9_9HELO|nr:uncharacterized protein BP5553_01716 [Venustampulla echinocandica]RDL41737.1 hypothetical protein BP5553_01716 [Venustampulla echinocandica]